MRYSVDALVVRQGRLFAYGWAFHPRMPIRDLALRVTLEGGARLELPVTAGKERPDVAAAFPSEPGSRWSGWMAYAGWAVSSAKSIELVATLADEEVWTAPISGVPAGRDALGDRLRDFVQAARRHLGDKPRSGAGRTEDAAALSSLRSALAAAGIQRVCLIIDHGMGGGANHYREQWVRRRLAAVPLLARLTFDVQHLAYALELVTAHGESVRLPCTGELPATLASQGVVDEVFANDAVSFPAPDQVPVWLHAFVAAGARLTVAVHDFLSVCPSPFLLNAAGKFCGVPSMDECMRCMRVNDNTFPTVKPGPDMREWRRVWGDALAAADTILCFSSSSQDLLLRAYPRLDRDRIRVVPHQVHSFGRRLSPEGDGPLHVGVVGAIGIHKGAGVVRDLAGEIAARRSSARITVFGTLEAAVDGGVVAVTGPYRRDELPDLIERSGANIFLLPSICPETFSYVTHELVELDLPLACFDLGAPAERISRYSRGRVLQHRGAAGLLDDLEAFHREMHNTSLQGGQ